MDSEFVWDGPLPSPDFTMLPDIAVDLIMRHCTGAEWKVLSYLMRETYGWRRPTAQLTIALICTYTGITKRTAIEALKGLEGNGIVKIHRIVTEDHGQEANTYEMLVASDPRYTNRTPPGKNSNGDQVQKSHRSSLSNTDKKTDGSSTQRQRKITNPDDPDYYRQGKYGHLVE